jgi:hypothetical protein
MCASRIRVSGVPLVLCARRHAAPLGCICEPRHLTCTLDGVSATHRKWHIRAVWPSGEQAWSPGSAESARLWPAPARFLCANNPTCMHREYMRQASRRSTKAHEKMHMSRARICAPHVRMIPVCSRCASLRTRSVRDDRPPSVAAGRVPGATEVGGPAGPGPPISRLRPAPPRDPSPRLGISARPPDRLCIGARLPDVLADSPESGGRAVVTCTAIRLDRVAPPGVQAWSPASEESARRIRARLPDSGDARSEPRAPCASLRGACTHPAAPLARGATEPRSARAARAAASVASLRILPWRLYSPCRPREGRPSHVPPTPRGLRPAPPLASRASPCHCPHSGELEQPLGTEQGCEGSGNFFFLGGGESGWRVGG